MKQTIVPLLLTLLMAASTVSAQSPRLTMQWQGTAREYLVYTPTGHNAAAPTPVLFFLHGLGGDISRYELFADFQAVADEYGWLVVMPQALPATVGFLGVDYDIGAMWNAGLAATIGDTTYIPNSDIDDSGFLIALIDTLGLTYTLDADSIFFTGISMGGFMTHRMAIDHSDRIAAAAAVSGLIATPLATTAPARPISMLHIHGTSDNIVGYNGLSTPLSGMPTLTLNIGLGVDSVVAYWVNHNGCDAEPVVDSFPDRIDDGLRFVRYTYGNGQDSTRVQLIKVVGGQHEWYMGEENYDIDYITEIHHFFTGQLPDLTAITSADAAPSLHPYPNPASQRVSLTTPSATCLTVADLMGRPLLVARLQPGTSTLDIGHLPAGIYLLLTDNGVVEKLIVR